ncbi:MAG: Crp/Fnr family transcriptional regulator [Candidatus Nanopelagicales bacterium]
MVAIRHTTTVRAQSSQPRKDKTATSDSHELREADDARQLRKFRAFDDFSNEELLRLVRAAHHDSLSAPWPLIYERTPSNACYILLSGEAGVYIGRDCIAALGPGEVIGESALRNGKLRSATVTTSGPAEVLRIERDDLAGLIDEIPALRDTIDATIERHSQVALVPPAEPKPTRSKLTTSVPTDLVARFERSATIAGVTVAAALEDALAQWVQKQDRQ